MAALTKAGTGDAQKLTYDSCTFDLQGIDPGFMLLQQFMQEQGWRSAMQLGIAIGGLLMAKSAVSTSTVCLPTVTPKPCS